MKRLFLGVSASLWMCTALPAFAISLSIGSGDGSLFVDLSETGESRNASYDPIGSIGSADTFFYSDIFVGIPDEVFATMGEVASNIQTIEQSGTSATTSFSVVDAFQSSTNLDVVLDQTVVQNEVEGVITGATLTQFFTITNTGTSDAEFSVIRYLDGDLGFDNSISDAGGTLGTGSNQVLFETDTANSDNGGGDAPNDQSVANTFVGITSVGGDIPDEGRFEISPFSDFVSQVRTGLVPRDFVENDDDPVDGFVDQGFDVVLAMRNEFTLAPGQSDVYQTQTIFGNAEISELPVRGDSESFPVLPGGVDEEGGFVFQIPADAIVEGETIFFDPIVSVGYTYTVNGAEFDSVTAPTFAAVPDPDGYVLTVDGTDYALASGQFIDFAALLGIPDSAVTEFTISGINPALNLDPTDPTAFVTGIAFEDVSAFTVEMVQTPISLDTGTPPPIPLPAAGWLLLVGVGSLGMLRRAQQRAAA